MSQKIFADRCITTLLPRLMINNALLEIRAVSIFHYL